MSLQKAMENIAACILTKGKIRECDKLLKEKRDELAESPLVQHLENLRHERGKLKANLASLMSDVVVNFPPDREVRFYISATHSHRLLQ
jgi:hypothetical protein